MAERFNNYETTRQYAQTLFCRYDREAMICRLPITYDAQFLYIRLFDCDYRVNRENGTVERLEDGETAVPDFNETMTVLDILCCSVDGCHPSGNFTPMQNLAKVQSGNQNYAGKGMFFRFTEQLDGKTEALSHALEELGGSRFGKGDVSYRIPAFCGVDVVVRFWNSDEDFPAEFQLLCDENTLQYMHYETVWYMAGFLVERIRKHMNI